MARKSAHRPWQCRLRVSDFYHFVSFYGYSDYHLRGYQRSWFGWAEHLVRVAMDCTCWRRDMGRDTTVMMVEGRSAPY